MTVIARKALTLTLLIAAEVVLIGAGVAFASTPMLWAALGVAFVTLVALDRVRRDPGTRA